MAAISDIVKVSVTTAPNFVGTPSFNTAFILGKSPRLTTAQRTMRFSNATELAAVFTNPLDPERQAAEVFFEQSPRGSQVAIGRYFVAAKPAQLLGGTAVGLSLSGYQAITTGEMALIVNGSAIAATSIDFTTATSIGGVAPSVKSLLEAKFAGTVFTYDSANDRWTVETSTTGASANISFAYNDPATTGTYIGDTLKLGDASATSRGPGVSADTTVGGALDLCAAVDSNWLTCSLAFPQYSVTIDAIVTAAGTSDDMQAARTWAGANSKVFAYSTAESDALTGGTTNLGYIFKQLATEAAFGVFSRQTHDPAGATYAYRSYAHMSAVARAMAASSSQTNSYYTLALKQLPGIERESLNSTEIANLKAANLNYVTNYGGNIMFMDGKLASGKFFDVKHFLEMFKVDVGDQVFAQMFKSNVVPQTEEGVAILKGQIELVCEKFVENGFVSPGVWNGAPLGDVNTGDLLESGYYVYSQPISSQSQADRDARKAPPFTVLLKGSGAFHSADISVTFEG